SIIGVIRPASAFASGEMGPSASGETAVPAVGRTTFMGPDAIRWGLGFHAEAARFPAFGQGYERQNEVAPAGGIRRVCDAQSQRPPPLTPPHRAKARGEGNPEAECYQRTSEEAVPGHLLTVSRFHGTAVGFPSPRALLRAVGRG